MGWMLVAGLLVVPWLEMWLIARLELPLAVTVVEGVLTAVVGWWFARTEDLSLWSELESDVQNHRVPTEEALDAMLVVLGGWLLIVPGFLTDVLGGVLEITPVRRALIAPIRTLIRTHLV